MPSRSSSLSASVTELGSRGEVGLKHENEMLRRQLEQLRSGASDHSFDFSRLMRKLEQEEPLSTAFRTKTLFLAKITQMFDRLDDDVLISRFLFSTRKHHPNAWKNIEQVLEGDWAKAATLEIRAEQSRRRNKVAACVIFHRVATRALAALGKAVGSCTTTTGVKTGRLMNPKQVKRLVNLWWLESKMEACHWIKKLSSNSHSPICEVRYLGVKNYLAAMEQHLRRFVCDPKMANWCFVNLHRMTETATVWKLKSQLSMDSCPVSHCHGVTKCTTLNWSPQIVLGSLKKYVAELVFDYVTSVHAWFFCLFHTAHVTTCATFAWLLWTTPIRCGGMS